MKRLQRYAQTRVRRLKAALEKYHQFQELDSLHRIRVELKKLRAVIRVVSLANSKVDYHDLFLPMRPVFRDSQINRFCEDHHGAGVQHVALLVKEIIPAVESLRAGGVKFLTAPPAYYDRLPARLEAVNVSNVKEDMEALRRNHILVDGKDERYMLQIFMQDAGALYGDQKAGPFFYEVIQREGDKGFGYGNFRALFESIETAQRADTDSLEVVG